MNHKKPTFLVIGAEKSGTTWLYNQLNLHPDVYVPLTKETHFFNKKNSNLENIDNYQLGWNWYNSFFKGYNGESAVGEVTPMYICDDLAAERIHKSIPDVKIIFILRNPIKRAYSHYWMAFRKNHIKTSFEKVVLDKEIRVIQRGLYYKQLKKYYNLFPPDQIMGFEFDDFFLNQDVNLRKISNFIGVPFEGFFEKKKQEMSKKSYAASKPRSFFIFKLISNTAKFLRRNNITNVFLDKIKKMGWTQKLKSWNTKQEAYPPMDKEVHDILRDYYREDIVKLELLTGLNLEKWRKNIR
ncbi:MAG: sulfotransferase [Saprospiraceae bacterium]